MRVERFALIVVISSLAVSTQSAHAQTRATDSTFVDLRTDGNGIPALALRTAIAFRKTTAEAALRTLADQARLNLTLDPGLRALAKEVTIRAHDRTIAVALLEIADFSGLRIRVSRSAQLVVVPTPRQVAQRVEGRDTTRSAVSLPAVRTEAERIERRDFETTTDLGRVSITRQALAATPVFVEPDVMRSVQTLPGIASRSDYTAAFNVRGGEGDQNLTLLDGYPIYNPFHLAGVFSTFIDATVGRVDLRTGTLPARYGGRLSGVLDVESAEPTRSGLHGTTDVSLASASASLGGANGNGTWMIAGRHTYADVIANMVKPNSFPYHFQDAQAHAAYTFANQLRVAVTAYTGEDESAPQDATDDQLRWGNSVIGMTLARQFDRAVSLFGRPLGDSLAIEQRLSLTRFDARMSVADQFLHLRNSALDPRAAGSITLYGGRATHTIGYEVQTERLQYRLSSSDNDLLDFLPLDSMARQSHSTSVYLDETIRPSPRWLVEAGARVDAINTGWRGISPRFAAKYFLNPSTAVTAAAGRYAQWIHALARGEELVQPLQFWVVPAETMPVSRATDAALGLERWITPSRVLHVEAFYKRYENLLITNNASDPTVSGDEFLGAGGTSYGAEVLLRQLEGGPFSGWLSYSYGVNTRTTADGKRYTPSHDRRHNLNAVGSWRSGATTISARLNLATGFPYTPSEGEFYRPAFDPSAHRWTFVDSETQGIPGAQNSLRTPFYDRLDLSIAHDGHIRGAAVSPYLSIVNVLNAHNPVSYLYSFSGRPERYSLPNLPFVPTFGVRIVF